MLMQDRRFDSVSNSLCQPKLKLEMLTLIESSTAVVLPDKNDHKANWQSSTIISYVHNSHVCV